jgi:mutator protein MutT
MPKPAYDIAIALVRRNARWLVAHCRREQPIGGAWEFPGGKIEGDETPAQAAVRELHEECTVEVVVERVLPAILHEYDDRIVRITPVLCRWQAGPEQPAHRARCRWVNDRRLRALDMPAANQQILRDVLADQPSQE